MQNHLTVKLGARDITDLLLLSAIWGGSFLFQRIAAPVFGPLFLVEMRLLCGFVFLLPFFLYRGKLPVVRQHWKLIAFISLANMALPFSLFSYAALHLGAGFSSILNATVPFFTGILAFLMFRQRLLSAQIIGLVLGFSGVVVLVLDPQSATPALGNLLAIAAGLVASASYGLAANLTSHRLRGVSGLAVTGGSLFFGSLYLAPLAVWKQPETVPTGWIWLSVIGLGVVCTGLAYILFYRLIDRIGSYRAVTVTFLVPLFSILWGSLFLGEQVTAFMLFGCLLVLLGVAMTTGTLQTLRRRLKQPAVTPDA